MAISIPAKVNNRILTGVKKYRPIIEKAKHLDVNESDTVTIVTDILCDIFGYDKYTEITSEYAVKKTFCDLAIKIDGEPRFLVEIKSAGLDLKEGHVRQAANYGTSSGIEWVVLTNGVIWKVYKIIFSKPVDMELVYEFDLTEINSKKSEDIELLFYLTKEAMSKHSRPSLSDYHTQKQIINKVTIGQILLSEKLLTSIRLVLKKLSPEAKVSNDEIKQMLVAEVIKREVLENEKTGEIKKKIAKLEKQASKTQKQKYSKPNLVEKEGLD